MNAMTPYTLWLRTAAAGQTFIQADVADTQLALTARRLGYRVVTSKGTLICGASHEVCRVVRVEMVGASKRDK